MKSATQVGALVISALVLFGVGLSVLGSGLFQDKADTYTVVMPDAGGLTKGARVLMAGVQVGEITEIHLTDPTHASMTIALKAGTPVPYGTEAVISGSLVGLGDTPLTLVQDPAYKGPGGNIPVGSSLEGGKAGPLDSILPDGGKELYTELNGTLKSVRALLEDQSIKGDVRALIAATKSTIETSQKTLEAFAALARRGDLIAQQNQATIADILKATDRTLLSIASTADTLEKYAKGGRLQKGVDTTLNDLHAIAQESHALIVDLRKTLNDPSLNANLRATADNLAKTSAEAPGLISEAKRVATNVADLTAKSQDLPEKLGLVLDRAAELESKLGGLVDKAGGVLGSKPKGLPVIKTQLDLMRETDPDYYRTDLNAYIPFQDGYINAGLWDAFGRNRVNLQVAKPANSMFDYRYGIFAGRPAVGVDLRFSPRLSLRNDVWDINAPRYDARLRYDFGGGLIGWMGMDRIFKDNSFTIGLGIRQ